MLKNINAYYCQFLNIFIKTNKMLKPLVRVIPTYSGNVKIVCTISDYIKTEEMEYDNDTVDTFDCYVRGAVLSPLSHTIYDKKIEANLLSSDYSYDLKKYFIYYNDLFYTNGMNVDKYNVQQIDLSNSIYDRNLDMEYGCSRVQLQKTNHQFEFFAPIYVDNSSDFPDSFYIDIVFSTTVKEIKKKIRVNIMSNKSSRNNYLCHYLERYGKSLESKVANISMVNKNGTFTGIDLLHGGMTTAIDNEVGNLFDHMQTMNSMDLSIAESFKRNHLAMRQVIPLCFTLDLDKILDPSEKYLYKYATVKVSGAYSKNNSRLPLYDWSCNYTSFSQNRYAMDKETGLMRWVDGTIPNIMDSGYPGLHEDYILMYNWSSKTSRMYSRWKMQASDDEHPYVINLAFPFSKNQSSNISYGTYPTHTYCLRGIAKTISNNHSSIASDYSFVFPLGDTKSVYSNAIVTDYEGQMNKYGYSWFDIVNLEDDDWMDKCEWKTIENNECYYNGVLHNLSEIYKKLDSSKEKIDKFAVLVAPNISIIGENEAKKYKRSNYTIKFTSISDKNALSNKAMLASMTYKDQLTKASCEAFTSISTKGLENNSSVEHNLSFKKIGEEDLSYMDNTSKSSLLSYAKNINANFVNPQDFGFSISDIDDWYDYSEVVSKLANTINVDIPNVVSSYLPENSKIINKAIDIIKSENLISLVFNPSKDTISTYLSYSYELLPIHISSLIGKTYLAYENGMPSYTYAKYSDSMTYINVKYGIRVGIYDDENQFSPNPLDEWIYSTDGKSYIYSPGWIGSNPNKVLTDSFLENTLSKYCNIQSIDGKIDDTHFYKYYWDNYPYNDKDIYVDPMISQLYMSSYGGESIIHAIGTFNGFSRVQNNDKIMWKDESYSYLYLGSNKNSTSQYEVNIYRKGSFFNRKWIDIFESKDNISPIINYENNIDKENFELENISKADTDENKLVTITSYLYGTIVDLMKKKLSGSTRYMFMPVMFGGGKVYANNVFVKKDETLAFNGNKIDKKDLDKDNDVIWCDTYNFKKILEKSGLSNEQILDKLSSIKEFKARFLDKDHMYWWYNELCKDFNYQYPEDMIMNWYDHIYVKRRVLCKDYNGNAQIMDSYTSLKNVKGMDIDEYQLKRFNFFFDAIEHNSSTGMWRFKPSNRYKENTIEENWMDLVFEIKTIKLDDFIYDNVMNIEKTENQYKDIYLYRLENDEEWERNMKNVDGLSNLDLKQDLTIIEKPNHLLIPLFNDVYSQDKKDTIVYAHYLLNDISEIEVNDPSGNWKLYRYNSNEIDWMIETTYDIISNLMDIDKPENVFKKLYYNYSSSNVYMSKFKDDLGYDIENFSTIKKDGTNYGFWLINLDVDNTTNAINAISELGDDNIKWMRYINGVDVINDPKYGKKYIMKVIRQLMPFIKAQPFDIFYKISTQIKPLQVRLMMRYQESLAKVMNDKAKQPKEMNLNIVDTNTYIIFQRYFGNIIPILTEVNNIEDQWLLKFKDTKDNSSRIVDTGLYPSIGDCVLRKETLSINYRNSTPVFVPSNSYDIKDYNNMLDNKVLLIEQKHFNDNYIVYCEDKLEWTNPKLFGLKDVELQESDDIKYKVFNMLIKNTNFSNLKEDQKLFLYKRYESIAKSEPIKLNASKTSKLYKITYKYILK